MGKEGEVPLGEEGDEGGEHLTEQEAVNKFFLPSPFSRR